MHHPAAGALRRCPVQPSTPLGPDQVNVLLLLLLLLSDVWFQEVETLSQANELLETFSTERI
jgi:hypothetical protein